MTRFFLFAGPVCYMLDPAFRYPFAPFFHIQSSHQGAIIKMKKVADISKLPDGGVRMQQSRSAVETDRGKKDHANKRKTEHFYEISGVVVYLL